MFKIRKAATGRFCTDLLVLLPSVCMWVSPYNPAASDTSGLTQLLPMNSSCNSWTVKNSGQHTLNREAIASYFFLWLSKFSLKLMVRSCCQQLLVYLCNVTKKNYSVKSQRLMFSSESLNLVLSNPFANPSLENDLISLFYGAKNQSNCLSASEKS